MWIEKTPENAVLHDLFHGSTAVQEDSQHALPQFYYTSIFLCLGWSRSVVCHRVLLRNRRNDEGWV